MNGGRSAKESDLRLAITQMISAVLLPAIFPEIFESFAGVKFRDPEILKKYVSGLLNHYIE